ncbi:hypothetical protein M1M86_01375 [Dehalococcoidales bacterium]|nr:hypothetical protein [Dehalococcoidales bacterium]
MIKNRSAVVYPLPAKEVVLAKVDATIQRTRQAVDCVITYIGRKEREIW